MMKIRRQDRNTRSGGGPDESRDSSTTSSELPGLTNTYSTSSSSSSHSRRSASKRHQQHLYRNQSEDTSILRGAEILRRQLHVLDDKYTLNALV